ncbi:hypothetical protein ACQCSX_17035 [Pseudarthrobacter sp. P1]|uniref:hypothetical protein n=1 Tax=Pseudarthrobacter sp. P1 TaxID=3418418 RepID=UPI003CF3A16B
MTYSNFTRPLWQWLAGDARGVDFFGPPLDGPNRIPAEVFLATHQDRIWPVPSAGASARRI